MLKLFQCPQCKTNLQFDDAIERPVKCPKCAFLGRASEFVEVQVRKVYCPSCNTLLQIRQEMFDGNQSVTCPKCKKLAVAANYRSQPLPENETGIGDGKDKKFGKPCVLTWQSGECRTKTIELKKGINSMGRRSPNSACNIQLDADDTYMSKNHATVEVIVKSGSNFEHRLSDNGSTNGTYHNERLLEKGDIVILMPGDTVRMGRTTFKWVLN